MVFIHLFVCLFVCLFGKCVKPVLAVVHGACVGGGVDMISACDMRVATKDTFFQIKVSL